MGMNSVWALQDAKNKFSAIVDRSLMGEPQIVTRRGKPVAVVMAYEVYQSTMPLRKSFLEVLLGGPKIEGGLDVERDRSTVMREVELG